MDCNYMHMLARYVFRSTLLILFLFTTQLKAQDWAVTNVSVLHGSGFKLGDRSMSTITIDHARSWAYGDLFMFADLFNPTENNSSEYGEFHPRFSWNKITGNVIDTRFLNDISIAMEMEFGDSHNAYLYGVGFDLNVPEFNYFNVNIYVRDNPKRSGKTWQVTPYWQLPFTLGKSHWTFEGFVDISGTEGTTYRNTIFQPQLLLDVGELYGQSGVVKAGIEYAYWRNKYGVRGVHDGVTQVMVKWSF